MSDRDTSGSAPETAPVRDFNPNDLYAVADTLPDDALDFDDGDTEDTSAAPNEPRAPRREAPQEPQDGEDEPEPDSEPEEDGSDAGEAAEGEEEASEAEAKPEEPKADDVIEIDGHKLTKDEIRRGYQRQADYTRKTQALAEQTREFEAVKTQTEAERGELQTILGVALEVMRTTMPQPPSRDMIRTDPMGYMEQSKAYEDAVAQVNQLLGAQQHLGQKQTAEQQQATQRQQAEAKQREAEELSARREAAVAVQKSHPHLFTDEGWTSLRKGVEKHSASLGLDLAAFGQITDPRAFPVLEAATKYFDLQAAKPAAMERVKAALPIRSAVRQAPGTRQGQDRRQAMDRLKREGTIEAAVATLDDSIFD